MGPSQPACFDTVVVSDDAGQFASASTPVFMPNVWSTSSYGHPAQRHCRRPRPAADLVVLPRPQGWQRQPGDDERQLCARFERIFTRRTGYVTLDRLLARLRDRKAELLRVLDRPEIPLHTNSSENDIRAHVTKRKISGGTQSEAGRVARDVLLGLMKTCAKLGLSFFAYLGDRLGVPEAAAVPPLAPLVRASAPA